jgi:hypothetical protein
MLLGSLTFTNGVWTGDADFGFTLTATDVNAPHNAYTFNGFVHMQLNTAPPGVTNPAQKAQMDADCVYLTNSGGQPVTDPQTGLSLSNFCVYELNNPLGLSNTAAVNLYGTIGSLDPTRFGDLAGGGFLTAPASSVPEPAQWPLLEALFLPLPCVAGVVAHGHNRFRRLLE